MYMDDYTSNVISGVDPYSCNMMECECLKQGASYLFDWALKRRN